MSTTTLPERAAVPAPLTHLLKSYTSSHPLRSPSPLPPSSRVDPKMSQRSAPPTSASPLLWTLPTWIAFAQFIMAKGLSILWALLKHFLVGPARKSWGYRMTLITSFMRNVANYTDFADIVLIRRLVSITYLIPLPADAVVTPITFLVPKRVGIEAAQGFLREWDVVETGTRELTGEWVVGDDVWKRLKAERRAKWHAEMRRRSLSRPSRLREGSVASRMSSPRIPFGLLRSPRAPSEPDRAESPEPDVEVAPTNKRERVIYYVHGGAYYVGNAATHRLITIGVSKACNARVFAITYRLAPESAFPLPLLDVLHGYLRLLAPPLSISPENIILAGDSAGGGLSLALCMYLRDNGYQLPSGLVLMSPWVDLTMSCGSWDENADSDVVPRPEADDHLNPVGCYLGPTGLEPYLTHPYASPLFGDLRGLPPMLIQSGDSEVLRDEITLLAHKASLSGVQVTHELYEDMVHVFQTFTWLPASKAAINSVGRWVRQTLPRIEWEVAQQLQADAVAEGLRAAAGGTDTDTDSDLERSPDEHDEGDDTPIAASPAPAQAPSPSATLASIEAERAALKLRQEDTDRTPRSPRTPRRQRSSASIKLGVSVVPPTEARAGPSTKPFPGSEEVHGETEATHSHSPRPTLRRAHTTASSSTSRTHSRAHSQAHSQAHSSVHSQAHSPLLSPADAPASPIAAMRRRRTAANLHMHASSPVSPSGAFGVLGLVGTPGRENAGLVSPPSGRRRLRAPTITSHPTTPTTRTRSCSHSDIFQLVDSYLEGGAANNTVVYDAGGEIRSVGVLGDEE